MPVKIEIQSSDDEVPAEKKEKKAASAPKPKWAAKAKSGESQIAGGYVSQHSVDGWAGESKAREKYGGIYMPEDLPPPPQPAPAAKKNPELDQAAKKDSEPAPAAEKNPEPDPAAKKDSEPDPAAKKGSEPAAKKAPKSLATKPKPQAVQAASPTPKPEAKQAASPMPKNEAKQAASPRPLCVSEGSAGPPQALKPVTPSWSNHVRPECSDPDFIFEVWGRAAFKFEHEITTEAWTDCEPLERTWEDENAAGCCGLNGSCLFRIAMDPSFFAILQDAKEQIRRSMQNQQRSSRRRRPLTT